MQLYEPAGSRSALLPPSPADLVGGMRRQEGKHMAFDVSSAVIPLAGVVLGGALSFAAQRLTQRSNERLEASRQEVSRTEARRVERLRVLEQFLACVQAAERAAIDLVHHQADTEEAHRRADLAVDEMWLAEKMVRVLCSARVSEAANKFAWQIDKAVDGGTNGAAVWDFLREDRVRFLDAAHTELGSSDSP
ncbi:hypothetical protein ACIBJF_37660 [Streptomyces sp. NPDC050743]|uniref:hypothetical protein n=1 Tax=Streptomyces sp. NPDC050743 TaxID=3365634 RepID=UPI0037888D09